MDDWRAVITTEAEEDVDALDKIVRQRVLGRLKWLQSNFENIVPIPLSGEWRGFFKLRIGDWRAIYEIDILKREVIVHAVGHRSQIYKTLR